MLHYYVHGWALGFASMIAPCLFVKSITFQEKRSQKGQEKQE